MFVFPLSATGQQNWSPGYQGQAQNQFRQSQYTGQMPNQYQGQMPNQYQNQQNQMYYGSAQKQYQTTPTGSINGSTAGGYQQQSPQSQPNDYGQGAFDGNSTGSSTLGGDSDPGSFLDYSDQSSQLDGSAQKGSGGGSGGSMLKSAAGGLGRVLTKSMKVAAPVAGAYMMNKAAQQNGGFYQPYANPYANPYAAANPYANPYAAANPYANPYAAANPYANPYAAANPYYGGAGNMGYYPQQQTMGNSLLNTGLRALFGGY